METKNKPRPRLKQDIGAMFIVCSTSAEKKKLKKYLDDWYRLGRKNKFLK